MLVIASLSQVKSIEQELLKLANLLLRKYCSTAIKGASIQRVLRGQWREDILWTLHEILLSKRMMEHHSLESHIKTLARC